MLTSEDDDGGSNQPGLDSIMEASLLDDWGNSSAFLDRIMEYFRSRNNSRDHNRPMGPGQDICAIQMAGQKTQSTVFVSTLSSSK